MDIIHQHLGLTRASTKGPWWRGSSLDTAVAPVVKKLRPSRDLLSDGVTGTEIGYCRVQVLEADVPQSSYFILRVESVERKVELGEDQAQKELCFPLSSLPSAVDLHLQAFDSASSSRRPTGRAIVPLGSLAMSSIKDAMCFLTRGNSCCGGGKISRQVMHLYLMSPSKRSMNRSSDVPPGPEELVEKYEPAIKGAPGSSPFGKRDKLGQFGSVKIAIEVELKPARVQWKQLFEDPWHPDEAKPAQASSSGLVQAVKDSAESGFLEFRPNLLKQGQDRICKNFRLPRLLRLMFSDFKCAVLGSVSWFCLIMFVPNWLWPFAAFFLVLLNGLLALRERRRTWATVDELSPEKCAYRVWEDQVGEREVSYGATQLMQLQFVLYVLQVYLDVSNSAMEKLSNLFSFADPLLSVIAYAAFFALCSSVSVALWLNVVQFSVAILGAVAILVLHFQYHRFMSVEAMAERLNAELRGTKFGFLGVLKKFGAFIKAEEELPMRNRKSSTEYIQFRMKASVLTILHSLLSFYERIPTDLELAHRFIATKICDVSQSQAATAAPVPQINAPPPPLTDIQDWLGGPPSRQTSSNAPPPPASSGPSQRQTSEDAPQRQSSSGTKLASEAGTASTLTMPLLSPEEP